MRGKEMRQDEMGNICRCENKQTGACIHQKHPRWPLVSFLPIVVPIWVPLCQVHKTGVPWMSSIQGSASNRDELPWL